VRQDVLVSTLDCTFLEIGWEYYTPFSRRNPVVFSIVVSYEISAHCNNLTTCEETRKAGLAKRTAFILSCGVVALGSFTLQRKTRRADEHEKSACRLRNRLAATAAGPVRGVLGGRLKVAKIDIGNVRCLSNYASFGRRGKELAAIFYCKIEIIAIACYE
jgi:hypothetical protein